MHPNLKIFWSCNYNCQNWTSSGWPTFFGGMQGWRNDSRGEGTRHWGPSRKRASKCLKGSKTTNAIMAIAQEFSSGEVKRAHFGYILGPPGSLSRDEINGAREGRSLPPPPPRFLQPWGGASQTCLTLTGHLWFWGGVMAPNLKCSPLPDLQCEGVGVYNC